MFPSKVTPLTWSTKSAYFSLQQNRPHSRLMPVTIIPHQQRMLRPHFPVNSIVQNDVLTEIALCLIGRNGSHHHIFHTIRDTKQSQFIFRKQAAQPTGGTLKGRPIRTNVIQMKNLSLFFSLAKISLC